MKKEREFIFVVDGYEDLQEPISNYSTFEMGLSDLSYDEDNEELTVILRRPGLLIGLHGSNLNKIEKRLDCKIKIIEKKF